MHPRKDIVLLTGSSGLIGSALVERLAQEFQIVTFDRNPSQESPFVAASFTVDLTSDEQVRRGVAGIKQRFGHRLASVIHLAAYYDFSGEPSPLYDDVNVQGTARLLRALKGFDIEQFIFASTMLVHAPCKPGQRIDEDWPLEAKWDYPQSKATAEQWVRDMRCNTPAVLLRMAGVYDDRCHSLLLAHQIQRIYERKLVSYVFPGDSSHGQAPLHRDDLMNVFSRLLQRRAELPPELALLVGEPETLSYDELQSKLGHLIHNEEWETHEIPKAVAKTGAWIEDAIPFREEPFIKPWMIDLADDHFALDIGGARTLLDWEPRQTLSGTLPRMVATLKEDPLGWYQDNKLETPEWLEKTGGYDRRRSTQAEEQPDPRQQTE